MYDMLLFMTSAESVHKYTVNVHISADDTNEWIIVGVKLLYSAYLVVSFLLARDLNLFLKILGILGCFVSFSQRP